MQIYYTERLSVPASWWVIGLFFAVSFVSAVGLYAGPTVSVVASLVTAGVIAAALVAYGRCRIQVDSDGLHAGKAVLDWASAGEVVALDREATGLRLGTGADPAAWLVVRGYVHEAVEVTLTDPADPHPYWLVSTRHPAELADAIRLVQATRADGHGVSAG